MTYLEVKDLKKEYKTASRNILALNNVSFSLNAGEFVVILGPSGAGKTTLLNVLGGMDDLDSGKIILDNQNVSEFNQKQLTLYRRNDIGFIFQFYNLMSRLNAYENVELSNEISKSKLNSLEVLDLVGLKERAKHYPPQLSGGEQQRVCIARAIAKNPKILLCDEPTGALDYITGKKILSLLYDISKKQNKLVILVTHNAALKDMADRVIMIKNGEIIDNYQNKNKKSIEEIEW